MNYGKDLFSQKITFSVLLSSIYTIAQNFLLNIDRCRHVTHKVLQERNMEGQTLLAIIEVNRSDLQSRKKLFNCPTFLLFFIICLFSGCVCTGRYRGNLFVCLMEKSDFIRQLSGEPIQMTSRTGEWPG